MPVRRSGDELSGVDFETLIKALTTEMGFHAEMTEVTVDGGMVAKSGVKKAHAHRFRHTLATELLGRGAPFEVVADIPGNGAQIVREAE